MKNRSASDKLWNRLILEMMVAVHRSRMLKQFQRLGVKF
jgi:hypothetical protein